MSARGLRALASINIYLGMYPVAKPGKYKSHSRYIVSLFTANRYTSPLRLMTR